MSDSGLFAYIKGLAVTKATDAVVTITVPEGNTKYYTVTKTPLQGVGVHDEI